MREDNIGNFVEDCYAEYGEYVNTLRHVPYLLDGMKPVYKRTLLTAWNLPDRKLKTATLVGKTIGELHPHGDASLGPVVDQLVHQNLLLGRGNFGRRGMTPDGDTDGAAVRYTEIQLNPKYRELFNKLLPHVPTYQNDLGFKEYAYLPTPYPFCLQFGTFGIGIGLVCTTPAFTADSLVRAGFKALSNGEEPWKLLVPNYNLTMSDEDKYKFWTKTAGHLTYNFKVRQAESGGLQGWYIEGDPSWQRPRLNDLYALKEDNGKVLIRDESGKDSRVFIAKSKRVRNITNEEIEDLVYKAASVKVHYNLWTSYEGVTRPITGGDWIKSTMVNFNKLVRKYVSASIASIDVDIQAFENFHEIAHRIMDTKDSYEKIQKELKLMDGVVDRVGKMIISTLRSVDPKKKLKDLYEKKKYFEGLTTAQVLRDFLSTEVF